MHILGKKKKVYTFAPKISKENKVEYNNEKRAKELSKKGYNVGNIHAMMSGESKNFSINQIEKMVRKDSKNMRLNGII